MIIAITMYRMRKNIDLKVEIEVMGENMESSKKGEKPKNLILFHYSWQIMTATMR